MNDSIDHVREGQSGWRGVLYLFAILAITALATILQLKYRGFEGPLSDNLLVIALINANFLLLAAVIFMIARSLWKLSVERKRGVLGARFRTKLVFAFVSLSFIPPVLLFFIGSGMFTSSIERLFSLRIETSLKDSVLLTEEYYNRLQSDAFVFGRQIRTQLATTGFLEPHSRHLLHDMLNAGVRDFSLGAIDVYSAPNRRIEGVFSEQYPVLAQVLPEAAFVERIFSGQDASTVHHLAGQGDVLRAGVPLFRRASKETVVAAVVVSYYIPPRLVARAEEIREGYSQYRSAFKSKEPIKLSYRLGFLAVTLALLLAAIWVALRVAAGITVPIKKLAEGTAAVASGRLDYHIDERPGDEVGTLIDSFNQMTAELKSSREQVEQEITYKKTILSNIETGVVSIDRVGRITTVNRAASEILGISENEAHGKRYDDAFAFLELDAVRGLFRRREEGEGGTVEQELSLNVRGRMLTLRVRVSALRDGAGAPIGSLITFEDLTELLRAKKAEAWQDVARRIAHEFKNPLTPIKLSAERLRKKYAEGASDFHMVFDDCSQTIVREADGLRKLVDEFSDFARMPVSNPIAQSLTPVLENVVLLYRNAHKDITIIRDWTDDIPNLLVDAEQMRRVLINLFQNAVEAMGGEGSLCLSAHAVNSDRLQLCVADDGPGIADEDLPRLFQPDFSRKKHKSGLGLAIVQRIVKEHGGTIRVERNMPKGARFILELPIASV